MAGSNASEAIFISLNHSITLMGEFLKLTRYQIPDERR